VFGDGSILIIDDDLDYSCLLHLALLEAQVSNPIEVINDSLAAVDYLRGRSAQARHIPVLVLLDLKMPKVSGLEVLRSIRREPYLANVPVIIFTGLERGEEERSNALKLGATSLHVKPFSYRELVREAQELRKNYLETHELKHAA
jgi:two-component system response regulator